MKNPHSVYGYRNTESVTSSMPDGFRYSPTSSYSDVSTVRKGNPLVVAAKSVAGLFVACFTPPETTDSKNFGDSEEFKPPSVVSTGSNRDRRRTSGRGIYGSPQNSTHGREPGSVRFTMEEIYKATRNFSPSFKIGQGGYGTVYKGRLEDGTLVAIKRAKKIIYDKHLGVEFQSEIRTLAQVEHLNLVKFYGFLQNEQERIVVVEYVPNGTLREHLDCVHGHVLELAVRLDIAIDVAHAVTYLHMYTAQAMKKFAEGDAISTLDPRLERTDVTNLLLEKILELALQCLAPRRQSRPGMKKCGEILWGIRKDCRELSALDFRSLSSNSRSSSLRKE
ncbi:hypothetical protein GH714_038703 [Hevea brasiliensis]|uniref:Protein kinase domain-containing protein n=1 Tax=Hevea brasiliensis TaxID=3981 RepID=A0A6A6MRU1_HEVBR|nr:hypothetical protein GH714_038703 [Hevea brasiliensis]